MTVMGVFQILIGSLFLALALWAVVIVRMALYASGLAPFFLAILVSIRVHFFPFYFKLLQFYKFVKN